MKASQISQGGRGKGTVDATLTRRKHAIHIPPNSFWNRIWCTQQLILTWAHRNAWFGQTRTTAELLNSLFHSFWHSSCDFPHWSPVTAGGLGHGLCGSWTFTNPLTALTAHNPSNKSPAAATAAAPTSPVKHKGPWKWGEVGSSTGFNWNPTFFKWIASSSQPGAILSDPKSLKFRRLNWRIFTTIVFLRRRNLIFLSVSIDAFQISPLLVSSQHMSQHLTVLFCQSDPCIRSCNATATFDRTTWHLLCLAPKLLATCRRCVLEVPSDS